MLISYYFSGKHSVLGSKESSLGLSRCHSLHWKGGLLIQESTLLHVSSVSQRTEAIKDTLS